MNAHLLDRIAEHTRAVSDYILPNEDLEVKVSSFFAKIKEPVLSDVKLTFPDGIKVTKMYPQAMPDLFQGRSTRALRALQRRWQRRLYDHG